MLGDLFAPQHLILILLIALIVFGPSRLPEIGRGLGQAIRGFRSGFEEGAVAKPHPAPPAEAAELPAAETPSRGGDPEAR